MYNIALDSVATLSARQCYNLFLFLQRYFYSYIYVQNMSKSIDFIHWLSGNITGMYFNLLSAMKILEKKTCIKFKKHTTADQHVVLFTAGTNRYKIYKIYQCLFSLSVHVWVWLQCIRPILTGPHVHREMLTVTFQCCLILHTAVSQSMFQLTRAWKLDVVASLTPCSPVWRTL